METPMLGMTRSLRTEQILGNCHGDENPDAWFPELPQGNRSESHWSPSIARAQLAAPRSAS